jgi:hypothetical protein
MRLRAASLWKSARMSVTIDTSDRMDEVINIYDVPGLCLRATPARR